MRVGRATTDAEVLMFRHRASIAGDRLVVDPSAMRQTMRTSQLLEAIGITKLPEIADEPSRRLPLATSSRVLAMAQH